MHEDAAASARNGIDERHHGNDEFASLSQDSCEPRMRTRRGPARCEPDVALSPHCRCFVMANCEANCCSIHVTAKKTQHSLGEMAGHRTKMENIGITVLAKRTTLWGKATKISARTKTNLSCTLIENIRTYTTDLHLQPCHHLPKNPY
jgi:hypothetical protein